MRFNIRRFKYHVLIASTALALAACGGDEPAEEAAVSEEPVATEEAAVIPGIEGRRIGGQHGHLRNPGSC